MQLPLRHPWCSATRQGKMPCASLQPLFRAVAALAGSVLLACLAPGAWAQEQEHTHTFVTDPELLDGSGVPYWDRNVALCEEVMAINIAAILDWDTCTNDDSLCPYVWPYEIDDIVEEVSLTEQNPGTNPGQLGHMEGGQFVPGLPYSHYKCPIQPRSVNLLWKLTDVGREVENGQHLPVDGEVTMTSDTLIVWDITSPAKSPVHKVALPATWPASVNVTCTASRAAYWCDFLNTDLNGLWSGGTPPATSLTLTVTTDGNSQNGRLPASNGSFGPQFIEAEEWSQVSTANRRFDVFYTKNAYNNPDGEVPNWYYYWSQTSASYGTHIYHLSLSRAGQTIFWEGAWRAYIGPPAADGPVGAPPYAWGAATGIDLFAHVCRHEAQHVADSSAFWPSGWDPQFDMDLDALPTPLESSLVPPGSGHTGYDPDDPETYRDHFNYGDGWNDCEDYAMHRQEPWTNGDADGEDWSAGTNSKQWP